MKAAFQRHVFEQYTWRKKKKLAKIKIFQIYSSNYKFFQRELEKEFFDEFSKIKKKKKHIG